jgi:regulator of protease activity HflC (stomatin/prohibitin superfamily)
MPGLEATMTELLKRVVSQIELLPAAEQDAIAELMERELEEREWDALLARPEAQRYLAHLVAQADKEDEAGETRELGDDW